MTSLTNDAAAATEAPLEILIPSLPNDVALQCLARVPRRYHPVLAAVSKPIRSLLSSPEFFAVRSALNCTEHLLYFRIQSRDFQPARWFTLYRRPNPNSATATGNFTMAPVPGIPNGFLERYNHAAVGPKIYVLGGITGGHLASTEMWMFDCRFHTWELGPSMPTARRHGVKTIVLDGKIYAFANLTVKGSWADVFDTVAGRWESLPSPELMVYNELVLGCGIRGRKVCVFTEGEELRFDTATNTWAVFGLVVWQMSRICEVNGVLYGLDVLDESCIVFRDKAGFWQELNLMNAEFPNHFLINVITNVGGRLVIMGHGVLPDEIVDSEMEATRMGVWCAEIEGMEATRMGVWCAEIEGKEMGPLDFCGEVLWSEMVYSCSTSMIAGTCLQVSL